MTVKDVCQRTGLSQKTVRLYVEKGLVSPQAERKNGRTFRTWTEADVAQLQTVAALRRAWFTMEEIRRMQQDPSTIQTVLPAYIEWLTAQQQTLQGLLAAANTLNIPEIQSVAQLYRGLSRETETLPLPEPDIRPSFRKLDRMEESQRPRVLQSPGSDRFHRDGIPVAIDQDHIFVDRSMGLKRQLDDVKADFSEIGPRGPVRETPMGPLWLRILKGILIASGFLSGLVILIESAWFTNLDRTFLPIALGFLACTAGAAGIHFFQKHLSKQQR